MLALERSRHEQSYLQQLSMDPSMHDPFGSLNIDGYNHLGYNPFPVGTTSFIDTPAFLVEAPQHPYSSNNSNNNSEQQYDNQKYDSYAHHPSASPSIATTLSSDLSASTSSSASGPSLPSTSSSTIGSPYQDSWIDMNSNSGLGPATVGSDGYPQEYVSAGMEADMMFAHEKFPDSFVGESQNAFFSVQPSQAPKLPIESTQHVKNSSVSASASASASSLVVDGHFGAISSSGFTWQHSDVASMASKNQPIQSMSPPTSTSPLAGRLPRKYSTSGTSGRGSAMASPVARSLSGSGSSPAMYSPEMPSRKRSLTQDSGMTTFEARKMSTAEARMKHRDSLHSPKRSSRPPGPRNKEPFENSFFKQSSGNFVPPLESSYPSLIQPMQQQSSYPPPTVSYAEEIQYAYTRSPLFNSTSPAASPLPQSQILHPQQHPRSALPSPYLTQSFTPRPLSFAGRRSSISSENSRRSQHSPLAGSVDYEDKSKEKGRCPHPDCGRVFKDLKAHMLTHQSERPEKCPIVTCEYHLKGFSRKYDKNRHTLTHYKGTMVCGFCPGSGSAAEKSFNRADVFKRHLTSVHGVEQTAPNSRKKTPPSSNRKAATYCHDATGKCSTCSSTFSNAQEFYEHLDDCVLRVVQQEEPSEAINLKRLTEVASDDAVRQTMEKHMLVDTASDVITNNNQTDDHDDDTNDSNDNQNNSSAKNHATGKGSLKASTSNTNTNTTHTSSSNILSKAPSTTLTSAGITKPRPTASRRRNNRNNYPASWGCPTNKMKMKKRVLCLYDGQRRLWKDEMMLDNEFEVRLKLLGGPNDDNSPGRDAYVTDLDVETLKRAEAVHGATEEERGPWDGDMGGGAGVVGLMGPAAVPLLRHMPEGGMVDEVNIDELMA
ncbi:hypothetical protein GX51_04121 [Blastomyces parvus]|uniref:C2H2-type domain-containing protein n=1 Tax=Blastomyces parvus TaxID=2060905 RepID=A0A2B7X3G2_9EURO|nr:hypothetical protein GX51_04121 [Blastomyces parvus]